MPDQITTDNLYREIIDHSAEGIVVYDSQFRYVMWNPRMAEITGVAAQDVIGRFPFDVFPFLRERKTTIQQLTTRVLNGETVNFPDEENTVPQTGKHFWISGILAPYRDNTGSVIGIVGLYRDVTEQRAAGEALRQSEARYRRMLETAYEGIWVADKMNIVTYANPRMAEMLGYSVEEIIGRDAFSFVYSEDVASSKERISARRNGDKEPFDFRLQRKGGSVQWVRLTATPIFEGSSDYAGILGMMTDTAKERRAQDALNQTVNELDALYNNAPCGYHSVDERGIFIEMNDTELNWIGYSREEVIGKMHITEILTEKSRALFDKTFEYFKRDNGSVREIEYEICNRDGNTFVTLAKSQAQFDENNKFLRSNTSLFDITEWRAAEKSRQHVEIKLRDSEARYRTLVDNASDIIYETDPNGHFTYFNTKTAARVLNYSEEEMMGQHFSLVIHPEWRERVIQFYQKQFLSKTPTSYYELPVQAKNGTVIWLGQNLNMVIENGRVIKNQAFCRDITERRMREEELEQSREKLRELSSHLQSVREAERKRIAHEIHDELGSSLTALKMDLSWHGDHLAEAKDPMAKRLAEAIGKIDECIQTVRKIATDLRPSVLDNLGLWAAIEWQTQDLQNRLHIPFILELDVQEIELPPDEATAIFRIFQETMTNVARHSGATKVDIDITSTPEEIHMQIRDNGRGMADTNGAANTQSFGILGMAERAKSFGGQFSITSQPQCGTKVSVIMPLRRPATDLHKENTAL